MFTILLSIPKSSKHSNSNEVNWESINHHFYVQYPKEFVCVIKPYNGDHTAAKVFFNQKVNFVHRSDEFLLNNSIPAKIVDRKEDPSAQQSVARKIKLPCPLEAAQLEEIQVDLDEQFKAELTLENSESVVLKACHQEVLNSAEEVLRKCLHQFIVAPGASAAAAASSSSSSKSSITAAAGSRRLLFPEAMSVTGVSASGASAGVRLPVSTGAVTSAPLNHELGPYDFQLRLSPLCALKVQPLDITSPAMQCDLMVVSTSCSMSLNFGLARLVAAKVGERALKQACQQHIAQTGANLKFGETHLVKTPANSRLSARYLLFVALPNDKRLTDRIDASQFKVVMADVFEKLFREIVRLSADPEVQARTVAMTALGSNLPYWADLSEDFAHVLAGALWQLRDQTLELRCLSICDLQIESLATLGRVLEARFGLSLSHQRQPQPRPRLNRPQLGNDLEEDDEATGSAMAGVCEICNYKFSAGNPEQKFHCNRGHLCSTCVARLQDTSRPGDGKCPLCFQRFRPATGTQPANGTMTCSTDPGSLPGHEGYATIVVAYTFGPGIQGRDDANPGKPYRGASRVAYFPDCHEGRAIVERIRVAFDGRAVFTIGASATTGMENTVTWATVHHKTSTTGGTERHGYPDPTYLQRVSDELSALGY